MIKINTKPVVSNLIKLNTCAFLVVTNYKKLGLDLLDKLDKLAFIINTTCHECDLVAVIPLSKQQEELWSSLVAISDFCKIERIIS